MIADELDMSEESVNEIFSTGSWHEKVSSKAHAMKLDKGTDVSLCAWILRNNFKKVILWILLSVVKKHVVVSMILRPRTSQRRGD
jgi:hypothetical protein